MGAFLGSEAVAQSCANYAPASVLVSGTISVEEAYGQPGYGEDPINDSRERYLLLTLDAPICVEADLSDRVNSESESGVASLQMVYHNTYPFRKEWLGRHVMVSGTFDHAFTSHHRMPVLITATERRITPQE